jgi:hypothetical protein
MHKDLPAIHKIVIHGLCQQGIKGLNIENLNQKLGSQIQNLLLHCLFSLILFLHPEVVGLGFDPDFLPEPKYSYLLLHIINETPICIACSIVQEEIKQQEDN